MNQISLVQFMLMSDHLFEEVVMLCKMWLRHIGTTSKSLLMLDNYDRSSYKNIIFDMTTPKLLLAQS